MFASARARQRQSPFLETTLLAHPPPPPQRGRTEQDVVEHQPLELVERDRARAVGVVLGKEGVELVPREEALPRHQVGEAALDRLEQRAQLLLVDGAVAVFGCVRGASCLGVFACGCGLCMRVRR